MIRPISLVSFLFVSSVALSQSRTFVLHQQVDYLLHQLVQSREVAYHAWALTKLRQTYPALNMYAADRVRAAMTQSPEPCLMTALAGADAQNAMADAWVCTQDPDLGVLYLSILTAEQRESVSTRHRTEMRALLADPVAAAYWKRLTGGATWSDALFSDRPFRAADLLLVPAGYAYADAAAPAVDRVLDRWAAEIPATRRNLSLSDAHRVYVLIDRHFQRNGFTGMVAYLPALSGQNAYPDLDVKLRTFRRLAFAAYYLGRYQTALDLYRIDLLPLVERMSVAQPSYQEPQLRVEIDYGNILFRLGDIRGARDVYAAAFPRRQLLTERRFSSALLNNLAVTYLNSGMTDEYIGLQLEALQEARAIEQVNNQLQILKNLYVFHWRRGDWSNAVLYLEEALDIAVRTDDPNELASILTLYATYHREFVGDADQALSHNDRAIVAALIGGNRTTIQTAKFDKALTLQAMDRIREATAVYQGLVDDAESVGDPTNALQIRIRMAWAYWDAGLMEEADALLDRIESKMDDTPITFDYRVSLTTLLADRGLRRGREADAQAVIEPVVDELFERIENSADAQTGFIRMLPEHIRAIRVLADLHIRIGDMDAATSLLDRVKSVNQATFANSNLVKTERMSESDRLADYQATIEMESIRSSLAAAGPAERLELNNRLLALQQQRNQRIRSTVPGYENRLDVADLRRDLQRNEMAVSITILDGRIYRTVLTRSRTHVMRLPDEPDRLFTWGRVMEEVTVGRASLTDLYRIGQDVFGDLLQASAMPAKLIFIPDGPLHRIPVDILPVHPPSGPRAFGSTTYLLEVTTTRYAASLSELSGSDRAPLRSALDFLGVGISRLASFPRLNPLPNAESEVEGIRKGLGRSDRKRILTGAAATETRVRAGAPDTRILHIASHSEINDTDPLFSVVYLESDSLNDGALYAYEWFGLSLNNDLVMLSSCESAGGTYIQGSGMIGLARALRIAGARNLIVNTWSIQDQAAADISEWFYEGLEGGKPYDEALRDAKIRYIQTRSGDPNRWGSFILIGDSTKWKTGFSIRTWFVLGGVLMLIAFWVLHRVRSRHRLKWDSIR